ncbi:MAG: endolytic transglycosylase MltG [Eubacteriales bacterium]|nr:endolytic transglycosylase MltG [Eubacteriales bacterium]
MKHRGKKAKKAAAAVLVAVTALSFAAAPVFAGQAAAADTSASADSADAKNTVNITVEPGDGTIAVADKLKDAGIISSGLLFRARTRFSGADGEWKPGSFELDKDAGAGGAIKELTDAHAGEVRVTIPEGKQVRQTAAILESAGVCGADEFLNACVNHKFDYDFLQGIDTSGRISGLEGYLYPDTYYFEPDSDPDTVIKKMLDRFQEKVYTDQIRKEAKDMNFSIDDLVKLASMVESEATTESDRKLVAGVFLNRLNGTGWKLQSCVTVEYAKGIKKAIISYEDTQYDSPYNTYKYAGLPYGPICCPGQVSINAVLHPKASNYYYFQSDSSGKLHFAETFAQHASIQKDVQSNWNTD